ncbi:MAG: flagellar hook protein FlgE [Magnetococcales bacterium]|nr:flagellar hook protein FlgE [Magnetococcales bacterium]
MSIMQAMHAGSSALTNYGNAMTVIGNNLANANTTGFKNSRSTFEDVLIQTVGTNGTGGAMQMGTGVGLAAVDQNMNQGSLTSSSNVTDLAIDGKGFFEVRDPKPGAALAGGVSGVTGSKQAIFYTRAGDFLQDETGKLVTNNGLVLQGWELDIDGVRSGKTGDVNLATYQTSSPKPTTKVDVGLNLDANEAVITDAAHATYDPTDPASYNHSTTVRVYDSMGQGHNVELQFKKTGSNTWEWHAVAPSTELATAHRTAGKTLTAVDTTAGNVATAAGTYTAGTLVFNNMGQLDTEGSTPIKFNFLSGDNTAAPQEILFNFGAAKTNDSTNDYTMTKSTDLLYQTGAATADTGNSGIDGTVQLATDFATLKLSQNGYSTGYLDTLSIGSDGRVVGSYTNGQTRPLYQIALVDFDNEQGLSQVGSNLFAETRESGLPRIGEPNSGRLGKVSSYTLEQSNVDMSGEFVTMITVQRAFQANSRIVSVTDGMLEELISLKR